MPKQPKRRRANNRPLPPRVAIVAMVPVETARAILNIAAYEHCSVSRLITETLNTVYAPRQKGRANHGK